jgi:hypothetical protein
MTREFLPYYPAAVALGCHLTTLTDTAFEAVYGVTKAAVRVKADALEVAVTKGQRRQGEAALQLLHRRVDRSKP